MGPLPLRVGELAVDVGDLSDDVPIHRAYVIVFGAQRPGEVAQGAVDLGDAPVEGGRYPLPNIEHVVTSGGKAGLGEVDTVGSKGVAVENSLTASSRLSSSRMPVRTDGSRRAGAVRTVRQWVRRSSWAISQAAARCPMRLPSLIARRK